MSADVVQRLDTGRSAQLADQEESNLTVIQRLGTGRSAQFVDQRRIAMIGQMLNNRTLTTDTLTEMPLDRVRYNSGVHFEYTSPTEMKCLKAGKYLAGHMIAWGVSASDIRLIYVIVNSAGGGLGTGVKSFHIIHPRDVGNNHDQCTSAFIDLAVGDKVKFIIYQSAAVDLATAISQDSWGDAWICKIDENTSASATLILQRSTNQTMPQAHTDVSFDTVTRNSGDFDTTDPTKPVFLRDMLAYTSFQLDWADSDVGVRYGSLVLNGLTYPVTGLYALITRVQSVWSTRGRAFTPRGSRVYPFFKGDSLKLKAFQASGGNLDLVAAQDRAPYLSIKEMGR